MNAALLLAHFNRISDAPDAVPRLRRFVLDLAVRGKLVEQNPDDEAASKLVERIESEKERLGKRGKPMTRKQSWSAGNGSFRIPLGWVWVPATFPATLISDLGKKVKTKDVLNEGTFPVVDQGKVLVRGYCNDETKVIHIADPIVLFGDHTRVTKLINFDFVVGADGVKLLHPLCINPRFYFLSLEWLPLDNRGYGRHFKLLREASIPLPPLQEQDRIIAKVDELMALCDQLETAQRERESRRDRLTAASHHYLNNGTDAEATRSYAQFFIGHLPSITARPDQIKLLRQTILNLAVRGKLVPQEPSDEPADQLLQRIHTEAKRRAKIGGIVMQPPLPIIQDAEIPFISPPNWIWTKLGYLVTGADAGWSPKAEGFPREGNNWGVLKVSSVSWDKFLPDENKQLLPGVRPRETAQVHEGDFLISRANTSELVAKCALVEHEPEKLILSDKIVRLQISESCSKKFLSIVNNHAPYARAYYAEEASGTSLSMKNVSRPVIYGLLIPLPPRAEQHRIVAKVEELMALCDQLEAQLTSTQTEVSRLLESVLYQAFKTPAQCIS